MRIVEFIKNRVKVAGFIKKVWRWIANEDWIKSLELLSKALAPTLSIFITLYLVFDILGKVPEALHINLVMLSATLGGLVFAGASFINKEKDSECRKQLLDVAKKFIIATFLFLIFFVFFTFIQDMNIALFKFDFSREGFVRGVLFGIAALGLYGGSIYFTLALVNLIFSLKTIR